MVDASKKQHALNVLVIGANGATGRLVTTELAARGHQVTAFVRRPDAMGEALPPGVRLALGDVMKPDTVERAVAGQDAVLVILGIRENPLLVRLRGSTATSMRVRSQGTQHVVAAMKRQGVRRLVVQSTFGVAETRAGLSLGWRLIFDLLLKPQIVDTERQESLVADSGLDWVMVRPVSLADGPARPALVSPSQETRSMNVPRASVARVLADAAVDPGYVGQRLAVSA
jgi:uncharacterized protein YbjT (DUF2867 family)